MGISLKEQLQEIVSNDYARKEKEEFYKKTAPTWKGLLDEVFGGNIPNKQTWVDIHEICSILNVVGKMKSSSHVFFNSGGYDLDDCSQVIEGDYMVLECIQGCDLIQPEKLVFYKLDSNPEWCYFRLVCKEVDREGLNKRLMQKQDMVMWESIYDFDKEELGIGIEHGNILIFMKASKVNFYLHDYMGNLNKIDEDVLNKYLMNFI